MDWGLRRAQGTGLGCIVGFRLSSKWKLLHITWNVAKTEDGL